MNRPATTALLVLACACAGPTRPAEPRPDRDPVETYRAFGRLLDPGRAQASTAATVAPGTLSAEERAAQAEERKAAEAMARDLDPARTAFDGRVEHLAHAYWLGRAGRLEGEREVLQRLCEEEQRSTPGSSSAGGHSSCCPRPPRPSRSCARRASCGPDDEVDFELAQALVAGDGDGLDEGGDDGRFVDDKARQPGHPRAGRGSHAPLRARWPRPCCTQRAHRGARRQRHAAGDASNCALAVQRRQGG
ncbi:MAG: hypothetical protein R3F30_02240 [Planctomycetota bacterium]